MLTSDMNRPTLKTILAYFDQRRPKTALAECLGTTKQWVSQWDEDAPIPEFWEMKLRYEKRPDIWADLYQHSGRCASDGGVA